MSFKLSTSRRRAGVLTRNETSKSMGTEKSKHNAGCEICAAYLEADALGAIPTEGHKHETIQELAEQIAEAIRIGDQRKLRVTSLLLAFAD